MIQYNENDYGLVDFLKGLIAIHYQLRPPDSNDGKEGKPSVFNLVKE